jgi:hypothetical protein
MIQKQCTKCGQWKDEAEFNWNKRSAGKRQSRCKSCTNEDQREYYQRTKLERLKYKASHQIEKRDQARKYVWEYLQSHPCVDCGEKDPLVLTFDHVTGNKRMNISQMVNQGYSIEAIAIEIKKCVVRCGNCHLRVEKQRRGTVYG